MSFLIRKFKVGSKIALAGSVKKFRNSLQFNNPDYEIFTNNIKRFDYLQPVYHSTERLTQEVIKTRISRYLSETKPLSDFYKNKYPSDYLVINGNQQIEKVTADIIKILKNEKI